MLALLVRDPKFTEQGCDLGRLAKHCPELGLKGFAYYI